MWTLIRALHTDPRWLDPSASLSAASSGARGWVEPPLAPLNLTFFIDDALALLPRSVAPFYFRIAGLYEAWGFEARDDEYPHVWALSLADG